MVVVVLPVCLFPKFFKKQFSLAVEIESFASGGFETKETCMH